MSSIELPGHVYNVVHLRVSDLFGALKPDPFKQLIKAAWTSLDVLNIPVRKWVRLCGTDHSGKSAVVAEWMEAAALR